MWQHKYCTNTTVPVPTYGHLNKIFQISFTDPELHQRYVLFRINCFDVLAPIYSYPSCAGVSSWLEARRGHHHTRPQGEDAILQESRRALKNRLAPVRAAATVLYVCYQISLALSKNLLGVIVFIGMECDLTCFYFSLHILELHKLYLHLRNHLCIYSSCYMLKPVGGMWYFLRKFL